MLTPPAAAEALLFASGGPMEKKHLAGRLGLSEAETDTVLAALAAALSGRGIVLVESAHEVELRTAPEAAEVVRALRESELSRDLGKASLETLAVIAYHDGATRGDIDWVRGVNSSASVRTLLVRGLIEGREDSADKRRTRYVLTMDALAYLGLKNAAELPRKSELAPETVSLVEERAVETT